MRELAHLVAGPQQGRVDQVDVRQVERTKHEQGEFEQRRSMMNHFHTTAVAEQAGKLRTQFDLNHVLEEMFEGLVMRRMPYHQERRDFAQRHPRFRVGEQEWMRSIPRKHLVLHQGREVVEKAEDNEDGIVYHEEAPVVGMVGVENLPSTTWSIIFHVTLVKWPSISSGKPSNSRWKQGECVLKEVYIAGGTFTMGRGRCPVATPLEEDPGTECPLTDMPQQVTVPPFFIDAAPSHLQHFPCTKERCELPIFSSPSLGSDLPWGAWGEALAGVFTSISGGSDGEIIMDPCQEHGKRLIREDEWEFVVTAGGTRTYPWGDDPPSCDKLWLGFDSGCAPPEPIPYKEGFLVNDSTRYDRILEHPPSPEGIYDLVHYIPHLVLPRNDLYNEFYSPIPYEFLVPFNSPHFSQPANCPTYPVNPKCIGYKAEEGPQCGERCKIKSHGVRGGRWHDQGLWQTGEISMSTDQMRSMDAYKGYVRGLVYKGPAIAHCVRDP